MPKADDQLPPRDTPSNVPESARISDVAAHILNLINSRPRTPTHGEIEGVVSRALANAARLVEASALAQPVVLSLGVLAPTSPLACELRRLRPELFRLLCVALDADEQHGMRSPEYAAAEAACCCAREKFLTLAERAWSVQDLIALVEVALVDAERGPNGALLGTPASDSPHPCCPHQRAQMRLLFAVARLTGCAVAQDGVMRPLNDGIA